MRITKTLIAPVAMLCMGAGFSWADSITPSSITGTISEGDSFTVRKTVTVSDTAPTTTKVDVYFLCDTTGSMGSIINSVKTSAGSILSQVAAMGADVNFAVGSYRDYYDPTKSWGSPGDWAYRLDQPMTGNQGAVTAGINTWSAGGGADTPESQLAALEALSQSASSAVGWRSGSEKIVVWFGDCPGHDPTAGTAGYTPGYPGAPETTATAALVGQGIQVLALNVGAGLLDQYGQASRITSATGGTLYNGINSGNVADKIIDAIEEAYDTYSTVSLNLSGVPAGVDVSVVPAAGYAGAFDRSVSRDFAFDVTFTGVTPGTYDFSIGAMVDGGVVASEMDSITVTRTSPPGTPDAGSTMLLLGIAASGLSLLRRKLA